jgi:O-antigen ligase
MVAGCGIDFKQATMPRNTTTRSIRDASKRLCLGDRFVLSLMFLLPVPSILGEVAARAADAVRFGSVWTHLLTVRGQARGRHVRQVAFVLVLLFVFACISLVFGESHTFRDVLDVLRIAMFCAVFLYGASLCSRIRPAQDSVISLSRFLLALGTLNAVFTLSQYLFPTATQFLQELYTTESRHIELLPEQGRAFGFFANPNTNAVMLLLFSLPGLTLFQLTRRTGYLVLGSLVAASVLLTASRTALILAAVMITVLCIASRKTSYLVVLALSAWISYEILEYLVDSGAVRDWFPYLSELLMKIHGALHGDQFDVTSINSFNARLAIWDEALEWFYARPILGAGPLRDVIPSFADNYYVYLLSRNGIVGLALYAIFTLYISGLSLVAILRKQHPAKEWGMLTLAALATVNVANVSMEAFPNVPIATITLLYTGYMTCLSETLPKKAGRRNHIAQIGQPVPVAAEAIRHA